MTITDPVAPEALVLWCRADRVLWRRTLGGVVVLPTQRTTEPVALRGPAAMIWELLAEPLRAADLLESLAATYGVGAHEVAADVAGALDLLLELGALCRD
ncbi:MAG TPA: PqqD family protein [Acidimicrobiia bacterium]